MPYATRYQVLFDNNSKGFYYSGDLVEGTAIVETCVGKVIRGTYVTLIGTARIKFENSDSWVTHDTYRIFAATIPVLQRDDDRFFVLPPGTYRYKFEYRLPDNIPSSFYGKFGFINYAAVITLDESKRTYSFKQPFRVMRAINYSRGQELKPIKAQQSKDISPWYCLTIQPLMVTVKSPSIDFMPGQTIYTLIKIENHSSRKIRQIDIKLTKVIEYCRKPQKTTRKYEFIEINSKTITADDLSGKTYVQGIEVPITQPTTVGDSNFINIRYNIYITVKVPACNRENIEFIIPVIISSYKGITPRCGKKLVFDHPDIHTSQPTSLGN
ncbi:unnamed protein product [Hermetia illucens]|uniref:Arrestin C-terminal-like domain-containing protein n=1 Tax=Hermetia illucens TaxID=343691 RepID=A0A7R8V5K3_HERIL|nr:unnamed protein product [Hermetia illucens]